MQSIRTAILTLALALCAGTAAAQIDKEPVELCSGNGTDCTDTESVVNWGQGTWVEFSIKDVTGCPAGATYQVMARNASSSVDILITTLSLATLPSHVFLPLQWYRDWRVVPSDITGCTSLIIVMHPVRPPVR